MDRAAQILDAYLRVTQRLFQQMRLSIGTVSLTFPQALILSVLEREGPLPIGTLAQRTSNANSTVSGIVNRLEDLDLVVRRRAKHDHRVIYVETTDTYARLRAAAPFSVTERLERLLSPMSDEEQDTLLRALLALDRILQTEEDL